jgi:hypothetical protein
MQSSSVSEGTLESFIIIFITYCYMDTDSIGLTLRYVFI